MATLHYLDVIDSEIEVYFSVADLRHEGCDDYYVATLELHRYDGSNLIYELKGWL
jgi:hypothetical protein